MSERDNKKDEECTEDDTNFTNHTLKFLHI